MYLRKSALILHFFQSLQISFLIKSIGVDQVLTKIFEINPKLTFNVFHILNHGCISKIEKIFDDTESPEKKLFWGLKQKDSGYVSGRQKSIQGKKCGFLFLYFPLANSTLVILHIWIVKIIRVKGQNKEPWFKTSSIVSGVSRQKRNSDVVQS